MRAGSEAEVVPAMRPVRPTADVREPGSRPAAGAVRTGNIAWWWGITGVALLFGVAVYRLGARGVATVGGGLAAMEWLALALMTALFVYGEGVRALQRRYVPWVIERVEMLRHEPRVWYRLLAPLHAMALIGGPRSSLLKAWAGSLAIFLAVLIVSRLPEPWRGITDFAVASALAWATCALIAAAVQAARVPPRS